MEKQQRKTTQLKKLLYSESLEFLMEAHSGISAKIAEQSGFKGIWASGLSISGQLCVRDSNEASWTQVLEVIEFMSDATSIPILLDADTGYGNFNNARRLVKKVEQRGIAGICIEDKVFPKTNSFIKGKSQALTNIEEFCGKIKAIKESQVDDDFILIARVEAFIAGWGLTEALKRADAYHHTGADGIFIHSALSVPDEVLAFKREWGNRCPVVIVPTRYSCTPTKVFRNEGFSIVIWANHQFRASVYAMQQVCKNLFHNENLCKINDQIVPVSEIFRLQETAELLKAEKRYLPSDQNVTSSIILATSKDIQIKQVNKDIPICMLKLCGKPLLASIIDIYQEIGIKNIVVVRGYQKEMVNLPSIQYVDNDDYAQTNGLVSLRLGLNEALTEDNDLIISYGDTFFKKNIIQRLFYSEHDFSVIIDAETEREVSPSLKNNFAYCSNSYSIENIFSKETYVNKISSDLAPEQINGIWTGLLKVSSRKMPVLREILNDLLLEEEFQRHGGLPVLINKLIEAGHSIKVIYTRDHYLNADVIENILKSEEKNGKRRKFYSSVQS